MDDKRTPAREAWVAIPTSDEAYTRLQPGVKPAYDFGFLPAMGRLVRSHPQIGPLLMQVFGQVMFAPGALSRTEREMIAAVTAAAQDCHYWTQSHAEFLRVEHGDPRLVEAIKQHRWREVPDLTPRTRALCTVAEKLSATPSRMVEDDWRPLRDLGFDDLAIMEVVHVVGIFNYFTRLADGLGLQLDPGTAAAGATGIPLQRRE